VTAPEFTVKVEWDAAEQMFAAAFLRDGRPWFLNGALVGTGSTRGAAVDNLADAARYLVAHGENYLTSQPLPLPDREWLFSVLDHGDANIEMHAALHAARGAAAAREGGPAGARAST
jgi:hypothetical protein